MPLDLAYATGSGVTITNTEMSIGVTGGTTTGLPISRTDSGLFMLVYDDVANMVKGDEYLLRIYETARASGTRRLIFNVTRSDAQSEPLVIPWLPLGIGWDMTAQRISASSRAIDWSIRRVS
jgi:hypothetical protein